METARRPPPLDQVREHCRIKHYTLRIEPAYVHWIRCGTLFQDDLHAREEGCSEYQAAASAVKRSRI